MSITQIASWILGLVTIICSLKLRKSRSLYSIYPIFVILGFHYFLFYSGVFFYSTILGFSTDIVPFVNFSFEDWSPVMRIHTELSILMILVIRFIEDKNLEKQFEKNLKSLMRKV